MPPTSVSERDEISLSLLGKHGSFPAFFRLYETLVMSANAHAVDVDGPEVPRSQYHSGVLFAAEYLKSNAFKTLEEIVSGLKDKNEIAPTVCDVRKSVNVAVQAMIMVDASARDRHSTGFTLGGYRPTLWTPHESFLCFAERSFPEPAGSDNDAIKNAVESGSAMKGWKLKGRLGVSFEGTDNLAEHLVFDPRYNVLYLFHHTAFLKAHLERFASELDLRCAFKDCIMRGTLPPQLLAETLHSIQSIIFPSTDPKSARLLEQLIRKKGFDSDCAQYDGYKRFPYPPEDFTYVYWGDRIANLHGIVRQKRPRSKFDRWIQWQTTESNALIVALLALFITIVLGTISLALACFQTWVTWQAWKYPVNCLSSP